MHYKVNEAPAINHPIPGIAKKPAIVVPSVAPTAADLPPYRAAYIIAFSDTSLTPYDKIYVPAEIKLFFQIAIPLPPAPERSV